MATDSRTGWFKRRRGKPPVTPRALTAAAARIDLADKRDVRAQRALRQGWQSDAWNYREMVGELRYAVNFLANCTARMRLYPAAYPVGGESDAPVPLDELTDLTPAMKTAATAALTALGNGKLAISGLLHSLSTNYTVAGECWLLGREDPATGSESWTVRSVEEIIIDSDKYRLREAPTDQNGSIPWVDLDPTLTVLSRIWQPSPRFHLMADSPLKPILDDCESLMIQRRTIRANGRSRLTGAGLLLIPDELSIKAPTDDNDDPEADPFMGPFAKAMMEPIGDEGVASAVVPIVVRGPAESLKAVQRITFFDELDKMSIEVRAELVGVIATGLDLPKEIITGVADLNHWSAWQVDDNTFRHHVEPHVIACCDALTGAYFRPALIAAGIPKATADRMLLWYDPTELVTHPDRAADAQTAHTAFVISDKALRDAMGFSEGDAPTTQELEFRQFQHLRNLPLNLLMEYARLADPTLIVPPITVAGTVPGIKPGGVDVGPPAVEPGAPASAGLPPTGASPPAPIKAPTPPADQPKPGPPPSAVTADGMPTGVMVAFYLPPDIAADMALDDGEPAEDLHLTLAFLGDQAALTDETGLQTRVAEWAAATAPLTGEISGVGLFTAGDDPVTYLSVDIPGLPDARQALVDLLDGQPVSGTHGFTPHVTLDYADRAQEVDVGGELVTFTSVAVVVGGQRTDYPLTGTVTAASRQATRSSARNLSRKLIDIDRDLRTRIQTAANAAMLRQLERSGAILRPKVAKDETLRSKIAQRPNERVAAILGEEAVTAALGVSARNLMGGDWSTLRDQFYDWTEAAQRQAIATAIRISGLAPDDVAVAAAQDAMATGREAGWATLSTALTELGQNLLYNPDPNIGPGDWADLNPDTLVPVGTIRAALGIAGGTATDELAMPVGQIGTGTTITNLLTGAGSTTTGYEWVHGPALDPFEPHEDLDGVQFENFDDQALANTGSFPPVEYFLPGDHDGCSCDFMPLWAPGE